MGRKSLLGYDSDSGNWDVDKNNLIDKDIMRTISYYKMNIAKKELMDSVADLYHIARGLLRNRETTTGESQKNNLDVLESVIKSKLFGEKLQFSEDETMRSIERALMSLNTVSNYVALGFNFLSNIKSTMAQYYTLYANATSNLFSNNERLQVKDLLKAHEIISNTPKKAIAVSEHLGLINMNEMNLVMEKRFSGIEKGITANFKLLDSDNLFLGDQVGDYFTKLLFMTAQMMKDGTWESYTVDESNDGYNLKYDKSKDKRDKKIKEYINTKLAEQGIINKGEESNTAYDSDELRRMDLMMTRVLGSVSESQTALAHVKPIAKAFAKMRNYLIPKTANIFKSRGYNFNYTRYELKNGEVEEVYDYEEGLHTSFLSLVGKTAYYKNPLKVYREMNKVQKENINQIISSMAYTLLLVIASNLLDEEKDKKKKKFSKDPFVINLLNSIMNDVSLFSNISGMFGAIENPFIGLSILQRLVGATGELLTLDLDKGTRDLIKSIGILKTIDGVTGFSNDKDIFKNLRRKEKSIKQSLGLETE
jgi:hypothetical protein